MFILPGYVTEKEVAEQYGTTITLLRKIRTSRKKGHVPPPHYRAGYSVLYRPEEIGPYLENYIKAHARSPK